MTIVRHCHYLSPFFTFQVVCVPQSVCLQRNGFAKSECQIIYLKESMHGSRSRVQGSASHSWNFFNKVIELTQSELMGNRHWNFEKFKLWGKKQFFTSPLPIPNYGRVYNWCSIHIHITFTLKVLISSEYLFHEVNSESGSLLDHRGDLNLNPSKICYTIFSFYISR